MILAAHHFVWQSERIQMLLRLLLQGRVISFVATGVRYTPRAIFYE